MINEQISALKTADEYLYKLKGGIKDIIYFINNDEEKKAFELLQDIAEGLEWIINVVVLTRGVQKKKIVIEDIVEHIRSILDGMENQDYILVIDLFNYEILPILERVHSDIQENLTTN